MTYNAVFEEAFYWNNLETTLADVSSTSADQLGEEWSSTSLLWPKYGDKGLTKARLRVWPSLCANPSPSPFPLDGDSEPQWPRGQDSDGEHVDTSDLSEFINLSLCSSPSLSKAPT